MSKTVPVSHNERELKVLEFLMKETGKNASAAIKDSCFKAAKELGYVPKK